MPCHERLHEIFALMILFWLHDPCKVSKVVIIAAREMWAAWTLDTVSGMGNHKIHHPGGVAGACGPYSVQEMALPADSMPAEKKSPNSPARRSSGRGSLLRGSRRRSRCAAMLTSSSAGLPLAFTWA